MGSHAVEEVAPNVEWDSGHEKVNAKPSMLV